MNFCPTLSRYFVLIYLKNFFIITVLLFGIVYLFDTIELIRRASKYDDVPMSTIMQMGLLKLLNIGQVISPFIILFSAMFTFWQLNKRSELIIVRSIGFSVWQFLSPILIVTFLIGIIQITAINPLGAILINKYEQLESKHLERNKSGVVTIFRNGLWLKQERPDGDGYIIISAKDIKMPEWELKNVTAMFFDKEDKYEKRIDASNALIDNSYWIFKNPVINIYANNVTEELEQYKLPTLFTTQKIEDSFSEAETMSFWKLTEYINTIETTGFDANRIKIYFNSLLAIPFLFIAMVLLAACVSMRPPRQKENIYLILLGIFIGFTIFFVSSYLQALGSSNQIPVIMASWTPTIVSLLIGISILLSIEDG